MEILKDLVNNQVTFFLPVVLVIIVGILVFTFGFKSAEQPPSFDKLTIDDRKQAGKKKKIKDKKTTANGHVSTGETKYEKSPVKESKRSPVKEVSDGQKKKVENNKQFEKNKKNETIKNKTIEEVKNKKNIKKQSSEKPLDFDDGNWETVPSKADKKKKPDQSPSKKEGSKKPKKAEKTTEIEKLVKEVVNKELREKEKEVKVEKSLEEQEPEPVKNEDVVVIEEKKEKEKKKEKKVKKEVVAKPVEKTAPVIEKEPLLPQEVPKPKAEKVAPEVREETSKAPAKEGGVAFDELGDVWTEAKAAKKSKKKARRDN